MKLRLKITASIFVLFSIIQFANSQTGSIQGVIKDKKTKETIVGANVYLEGTTTGVATNLDGGFEIKNISQGNYTVVISFISYKTQKIQNVKVSANKAVQLNIELEEEITTIQGVVVQAKRKTDTDVSMINTIKASNMVVSGMSSQQISQSQDKDASEVVRRIPGVTIIDDRFIVVRGLIERYNTVQLNNASTPSSESDVKAFSFDVIPSAAIDRILVYKTPSPELPAEFSGANVAIFTKNIPEKNGFQISYNSGFRMGTTLNPFFKYEGSSTDKFGYDNGTREIPDIIPSSTEFESIINNPTLENKQKRAEFGRAFSKIWTPSETKAPIDQSFSINYAGSFKVRKMKIGNISSFSYGTSCKSNVTELNSYNGYDTINDISIVSYHFIDSSYSQTVKMNALSNFSLQFNENHTLEFRNLFNQQGTTKTTLRSGVENYRDQFLKSIELGYNQQFMLNSQLGGTHKFRNENTKIQWTIGYSKVKRDQPDIRRLTSTLPLEQDPDNTYYNQYNVYFPNRADPELAGRLFLNMNEQIWVYSADVEQKIRINDKHEPILKFGFFHENRKRSFNSRLFGFVRNSQTPWYYGYQEIDTIFADYNINYTKGIRLDEATSPTDSYTADNQLTAGFVAIKHSFWKGVTFYGGVRLEHNIMTLTSMNQNLSEYIQKRDTINIFPSVNLSYNFNAKSLIRVAYGKTINRPEFREIAPYNFYNFEEKAGIYGNTELKSAYIDNFDLRYEFYPSPSEMINVGFFYKSFTNPIEANAISAGSGKNYTFKNVDKAQSLGVEIDVKKTFKNLKISSPILSWVKNTALVMNASLIQSKIEVDDAMAREKVRPMQGQSPYIINTGIFYQNDSLNFSCSIMYNVIGKRIAFVGNVNDPHIYELSRNVIDLTIMKTFYKRFQIKLGIKDILNQPIILEQYEIVRLSSNPNIEQTRVQSIKSITPGTQFFIGINFSF